MVPAGDARRGAGIASGDGNASTAASASADPPPTPRRPRRPLRAVEPRPRSSAAVDKVKFALLKALAPLDRGVAASDADRDSVRSLAEPLGTLASANPSSLSPVDDALERALRANGVSPLLGTFAGERPGSRDSPVRPAAAAPRSARCTGVSTARRRRATACVSLDLAKSPLSAPRPSATPTSSPVEPRASPSRASPSI